MAEALTIPAQRLYTSDLLGLTGGPRTTGPAADDAEVVHLLSQVPGALLSVGDPAALSTAPVWDALKASFPGWLEQRDERYAKPGVFAVPSAGRVLRVAADARFTERWPWIAPHVPGSAPGTHHR